MKTAALAFALAMLAATGAHAQDRTSEMVGIYTDLNVLCRGGAGSDAATDSTCAVREKVYKLLVASGYCLRKQGQSSADMKWHKCTTTSERH